MMEVLRQSLTFRCFIPVIFVFLVFSVLLVSRNIQANEVSAVRLDRFAEKLENQARNAESEEKRLRLLELAKRKRESARIERENHYKPTSSKIQNSKSIQELDRPFPKPKDGFHDGIFEFALGFGSGFLDSSPGGEFLNDPYLAAFAGTYAVPRTSLAYDNIYYINPERNPRNYAVHPLNIRIQYFDKDYKHGYSFEDRGIAKDSSYTAWSIFDPNYPLNAFLTGQFNWNDTKFNFLYREDWSYDKTLTVIWGLRLQTMYLKESAVLPMGAPGYYHYNEESFSIGPNIGMAYSQNFLGLFVFTAGIEVSIGEGFLFYDRTLFREGTAGGSEYFSLVESEKPILMSTIGGEFYTKYDFLISRSHRLGIGLTYNHFWRATKSESLPHIWTNSPENYYSEYMNYFQRNFIYNRESERADSMRYRIFRWVSLEYTYVF